MGMQMLIIFTCHIMFRIYSSFYEHLLTSLEMVQANLAHGSSAKRELIQNWKAMFSVMRNQMKNISNFISPAGSVHLVVKVIVLSTSVYTLLQSFAKLSKTTKTDISKTNEWNETNTNDYPDFMERLETPVDPLINSLEISALAGVTVFVTVVQQIIGVFFPEKIYESVLYY